MIHDSNVIADRSASITGEKLNYENGGIWEIFKSIASGILLIFLIGAAITIYQNLTHWVGIVIKSKGLTIAVTMTLALTGLFLSWVKEVYAVMYVSAEVIFGVSSIFISFDNLSSGPDQAKGIISLIGGIYIIVRSRDNYKGIKKKVKEKQRDKDINEELSILKDKTKDLKSTHNREEKIK